MRDTITHYKLSLTAYVLMQSHIHLLIGFPRIEEMSTVMKSLKRLSTRRLIPLIDTGLAAQFNYAGSFLLWQPRFDDVIIWSEQQFRRKIEYIHNNPVKAGLVRTATDYIYSSAGDWLSDKKGTWTVDKKRNWLKDN